MRPPPALVTTVADFCLSAQAGHAPVAVGLGGPQGAGKSTLAAAVVAALAERGHRAVALSIDDFYLTHAEQRALYARTGNRYLEHRGYPGTHDVELGARVLDALLQTRGEPVVLPVYDKSAHAGRGDRAAAEHFRTVRGPLRVVLLEGWLLGFTPVAPEALPDPALRLPNQALGAYAAWHRRLSAFVQLVPPSLAQIVAWRVDAERARRAAGAPGLSDADARDYSERFLPAYAAYLPPLAAACPISGPVLRVPIGPDRQPLP